MFCLFTSSLLLTHHYPQKCDGVHPQCGPCRRNPKGDLCEWDSGLGKSKMATLIEEVATLRARIIELENPGLASASVTLYDPYGRFKDKTRSPLIPEPPRLGLNSPISTTSTHPSGRHSYDFAALQAITLYRLECLSLPSIDILNSYLEQRGMSGFPW